MRYGLPSLIRKFPSSLHDCLLLSSSDICHKNFSCQSKLVTHLNVHNKPPKSISSESSQHQQNTDPNLQPFPPQRFIFFDSSYPQPPPPTRGQLVQYILDQELHHTHSSDNTTLSTRTLPSGAYPCEICFEIFRKKTLLRTHKLSAHGVAEFRCGLFPLISSLLLVTQNSAGSCQKIFNRKSKLEHHQQQDGRSVVFVS
jgi:hypothetical protein